MASRIYVLAGKTENKSMLIKCGMPNGVECSEKYKGREEMGKEERLQCQRGVEQGLVE